MTSPVGDLLVTGIGRLVTMTGSPSTDAALLVREGVVTWSGRRVDVPAGLDVPVLDAGGAAVVPGFVDPHTHLLWAGSRREEFEARLEGRAYDGSGILDTVRATTATGSQDLRHDLQERLLAMASQGTTTTEVKTGYGLYPAEELRQLEVILSVESPVRVEATYLAHVPPPDTDREEHVAATASAMAGAAVLGARWADVFCDTGAFTHEETRRILGAAQDAGLGTRMHADQLSANDGASLAAELGCASADHLECVSTAGARSMAAAGTVAVLVPTATLTTAGTDWSYAERLRAAGVELALSTDCNPGTSWCESMPLVIQLACLALRLPVGVALRAATLGGAHALRRDDVGHLGVGARGDLVVLEAGHEADLVAHLGAPAVRATVVAGVELSRERG